MTMTYKQFSEQTEIARRANMINVCFRDTNFLVPKGAKFAPCMDENFVAYREEGNKIRVCTRWHNNVWMDEDTYVPNTEANRQFIENGLWCDAAIDWFIDWFKKD